MGYCKDGNENFNSKMSREFLTSRGKSYAPRSYLIAELIN